MLSEDSIPALLYHAHHSLNNEDLEFWLELAALRGDPILELACGTGRLLIPMLEAGFDVTGLDHDAGMLAYLRSHISKELVGRAQLFQADLGAFRLERKFSLIFLACNTYSTLTAAARRRMLSLVWEHLSPGSLFAASVPNPAVLAGLPAYGEPEVEEVFSHPESGHPVQVSSEFEKDREWFSLRWHYDLLLPDGRSERNTIETRHALDGVEIYSRELAESGLSITANYGDYDSSEYDPDSPYLILLAGKS